MNEFALFAQTIVKALVAAPIPYMITGSVASTAYGAPRSTYDLDLVIDPSGTEPLDRFLERLETNLFRDPEAARAALARRTMFNVIDAATGWKADLIVRKERAFSREEFARRQTLLVLGQAMDVASPEDVIVSKLEWSRAGGGSERQRRDIQGILDVAGNTLDFSYLERWIAVLDLGQEWRALVGGARGGI